MKRFLLIAFVVFAGIYAHATYGRTSGTFNDLSLTGGNETAIRVQAYPNPTNGMLTVEVNGDFDIKIFDLLGQDLELDAAAISIQTDQKKASFNLSSFPNGIYFIKVSDLETKTQKMVKIKKF